MFWYVLRNTVFDSKRIVSRCPVSWLSHAGLENDFVWFSFFCIIQWNSVTSLEWTAQERGCSSWLMKQTWMKSWSLRGPSYRSKPWGFFLALLLVLKQNKTTQWMGKKKWKLDYTVWNWQKYVNVFPWDRMKAFLYRTNLGFPCICSCQDRVRFCIGVGQNSCGENEEQDCLSDSVIALLFFF